MERRISGKDCDVDLLELIAEMKDSKTVITAYHTNDPNAGMSNHKDLGKFKLFLADTGLFTTLAFKDEDFTELPVYMVPFLFYFEINKTATLQQQNSNSPRLYYSQKMKQHEN